MAKSTVTDRIVETFNKLRSSRTDQYILSQYINQAIKNRPKTTYSGRIQNVFVSPSKLYNMMTMSGVGGASRRVFNTFNNAQLSFLTPVIKFFVRDSLNNKIVSIPLQNIQNEYEIFESVESSNATLGLKNIEVNLTGDSPETAKSDIDTSITFYGNTLAAFEKNTIYQNLILPGVQNSGNTDAEEKVDIDLIMHVGWAVPSDQAKEALEFTPQQIAALDQQYCVFVMKYTQHNFAFNQDGSFILSVDYVSYIDESMLSSNLLAGDTMLNLVYPNLKKRSKDEGKPLSEDAKKLISNFIEKHHSLADAKTKVRIKRALEQFGVSNSAIQSRIKHYEEVLRVRSSEEFESIFGKLKYTTLMANKREINKVLLFRARRQVGLGGSFKNIGSRVQKIVTDGDLAYPLFYERNEVRDARFNMSDYDPETGETVMVPPPANDPPVFYKHSQKAALQKHFEDESILKSYEFIKYTTLGSILETFINRSLRSTLKSRNFQLVLGTLQISNGSTPRKKLIPLYNLPISQEAVKEVTRKIYTSRIRQKISIMVFIQAIMKEVVEKYYLNGDYILDAGGAVGASQIKSAQFSVTKEVAKNVSKYIKGDSSLRSGLRALASSNEKPVNLFFMSAGPSLPDIKSDLDYYTIASANSIVKKVNYTQSNLNTMKARRDENIVQAYQTGNLTVLPQLYNVKMDIVGNLNFIPGYYFHLWPNSMGLNPHKKDSVLKKLGLMGTYMTIKVSHSIGQSGFTTSIDAYNIDTKDSIQKQLEREKDKKKQEQNQTEETTEETTE